MPPLVFQDQAELTVPMLEHLSIHNEGIQDCQPDLSMQELVVSKGGPLILSIKEAIQEKIDEIQELKIKIGKLNDLLQQAESRVKLCIVRKDDEIKSLKEHYEGIIAKKDEELQKARDEAASLKQDNKELQKKLEDELARITNEYEEKLKELENAKEVECLKLQLKHKDETHKLELQVKELECQLAAKNAIVEEKKATIAELEKLQLEQKLKEQEKESKRLEEQWKESERQVEQQQRLITSLQEKLSGTLHQQVEVPTSTASRVEVPTTIASSDRTIRITSASAVALQPIITDRIANLTRNPPMPKLDSASNTQAEKILKNGSSIHKI